MNKRDKTKKRRYRVDEPKLPKNKNIKFSFEFYDTGESKYCISKWKEHQILETLKRLKDINQKTFYEMSTGGRTYHFHPVCWESTVEKKGFSNLKVNQLEAFQFGLLGVNGQKARVFGGYADNTFYIVWFDLEHKIWPTFKKHT
ncbi:MAG: hypothetical protein KKA19_06780 [Candidatus Margulisbacteria bacterium]|nr:hypothetical protein [Candidatus Margulisiibacteriota bacterium]